MKKGYYTDLKHNVEGYWELDEKPVDGEYIWVESNIKPELYVSPEKVKESRIAEIDAKLDDIDKKSIRAIRTKDNAKMDEWEQKATALRTERASLI